MFARNSPEASEVGTELEEVGQVLWTGLGGVGRTIGPFTGLASPPSEMKASGGS